ncbi:CDP-glucose 4,6-dehydratase [Erythrobacter sp. GH1-10]|uniref:CDP-glucose 4,6-dehydratase n=1 Tax=Erythrobacter sp. GH1-10 TaxID=3349334 RepID=UPI003877C621
MSDAAFKTTADAFRGKRVLVTGHTGFKGGWLSLWLSEMGAEVTGVALPPPDGPSLFESAGIKDVVDHRLADIRNVEEFERATADCDPELVIHMAAQSLVRPSYEDPIGTIATNVTGTAVVLDRARRMSRLKGVIVVTSDKCYENHEWAWPYRENDQLGGADPYSASKGCTEIVANAFRQSYFSAPGSAPVATVRAGNVFGGGDWAVDRLIPDIIRATLSRSKVTIRNPSSVRPWQHVLEPLSGYLELGAHLMSGDGDDYAEAWNFGPPSDAFMEVDTIARGLQRHWGEGAAEIEFGKRDGDPHEAGMLTLDSSKARQRLHWKPMLSTEQAIAMTAEWYRAFADGNADMGTVTRTQIRHYENLTAKSQPQEEKLTLCA